MSIDLSDVVWLRRTLARGALGVKIASLNVAVQVAAFIDGFSAAAVGSTNLLVVLAACAVTVWAGFRFAGALQRGSRRAGWTALALSLPYLGIFVMTFDWYNGLFKLVTGVPLVFIVLAGLARVSPRSERAIALAHARQIDPFRSGAAAGRARSAFGKKLSFGLYIFLGLLVLATIVPPLTAIGDSSNRAQLQAGTDEASFGQAFGSDLGRKLRSLIWTSSAPDASPARETGALFGTLLPPLLIASFLYRRARRHAMMRVTDLARRKGNDAVIVYLRSFADDRLKMRARAANGRWWLESVLRVSFEEVLVDHLWRVAAVIAIGRPGEKLTPLGAAREWVSGDAWQAEVEHIVRQARLVVGGARSNRRRGLGVRQTEGTELSAQAGTAGAAGEIDRVTRALGHSGPALQCGRAARPRDRVPRRGVPVRTDRARPRRLDLRSRARLRCPIYFGPWRRAASAGRPTRDGSSCHARINSQPNSASAMTNAGVCLERSPGHPNHLD